MHICYTLYMQLNSTQNGHSKDSSQKPARPKQRRTHKAKSLRITITIPDGLLDIIDKAADQDYTTRSDIIRLAVLWYLRPQGRDFTQVDPDEILKTLQHRKALVGVRKMTKDINIFED